MMEREKLESMLIDMIDGRLNDTQKRRLNLSSPAMGRQGFFTTS
jgi:hypothetical protein